MHPIIRIKADWERSPVALQSQQGLDILDIAPIIMTDDQKEKRENGATLVHAKAMRTFLQSGWSHVVVLEDDAILNADRSWLSLGDFDFFVPFAHNRVHLKPDLRIRRSRLPKYGAFAYLCSRKFGEKYLELLEQGGLADVVSHQAAKGMVYGSYAGNLVNHDNEAPSMISEDRRLAFLKKQENDQAKLSFVDRIRLTLGI